MFFTLTLGDSYFPFLAYSCFPITSIPEPDETGCSESSISHDDMADFLRQKTQELKEAHLDQLVHEAVTVLENVGPKETEEILLHTPNPGFFETMTGLL